MVETKVLFILKRREDYICDVHNHVGMTTGLYNSAMYVLQKLLNERINADLEIAIDNNCIDRLVTKHKPTHVIIEALWVTPAKFAELIPLHPNVKWIIRLHSEMPFMAGEGIAMNWLADYLSHPQVSIAANAPRMLHDVKVYLKLKFPLIDIEKRVFYLPNAYPNYYKKKIFNKNKKHVDVACFGAIRPLKNHLLQAVAALKFANLIGKKLHFHINSGRFEMNGEPIMHNLKGLFMQLAGTGHELIYHKWAPKDEFLKTCEEMDIGLQCNFSETFNIVSADLLSRGVPIVGSKEIPWCTTISCADPSDCDSIVSRMLLAYNLPQLNVYLNKRNLTKYCNTSVKIWKNYFKHGKI